MLEAMQSQVLAITKRGSLELRMLELDAIVRRYTSMIGITSLGAGFAFTAMVELDIPEQSLDDRGTPRDMDVKAASFLFYIAGSLALLLSLYTVSVSTFAVAAGYRLALQGGEQRSIDRAAAVLLIQFRRVFIAAGSSLVFIIIAAGAVVWIKLKNAGLTTATSIGFAVGILLISLEIKAMSSRLRIASGHVVHGDVKVHGFDLSNIEMPGADSSALMGSGAPRSTERDSSKKLATSQASGQSGQSTPRSHAAERNSSVERNSSR
jgi:hypothetical protein